VRACAAPLSLRASAFSVLLSSSSFEPAKF